MKSIRILDRYLGLEFIKSFSLSLISLVGLFLIISLLEAMRIDSEQPREHLYMHFLYMIPQITVFVIPAALMFSICFTVAQFTVAREIVAMHAAGVSYYRIVAPILMTGVLVTIFLVLFQNTVVSPANRLAAEEMSTYRQDTAIIRDIVWQRNMKGLEGYYFIYYYDRDQDRIIGGFHYMQKEDGRPVRILEARSVDYVEGRTWRMNLVQEIFLDEDLNISSYEFHEQLEETFPEDKDFFANPARDPAELNIFELLAEIRRREAIGFDTAQYRVRFHASLSFPFMAIIVSIIGSIAGGMGSLRSGGPLVRSLLLSTATILVYETFFRLGESLGMNGFLNPIVAGWGPTLIFLGFAAFLIYKNQK